MSLKLDFFNTKDWRFLKYPLCACGVWPDQPLRIRAVVCPLVLIGFLLIYIPEGIRLVLVRKNIVLVSDCVPIFGIHTVVLFNFCCCIIKTDKIRKLLEIIQQDRTSENLSKEEIVFLKKKTAYENKIVELYAGSMCVLASVVLLVFPWTPTLLDIIKSSNGSRPVPGLYNAEYLVGEKNMVYVHIYEYLITPFPTLIICGYDSLYAATCQHICNMLHVLGYRFKNLAATIEENKTGKTGAQLMGQYINDHKQILSYFKVYLDVFAMTSFILLVFVVLTLCLCGIQCIVQKKEIIPLLRFGSCGIGIIFKILFLSIVGQKFINYTEKLLILTTQSEWYKLPLNLQKVMVILILQFSQPANLKVGGIFEISLASCMNILRLTMSYFTVANAVLL